MDDTSGILSIISLKNGKKFSGDGIAFWHVKIKIHAFFATTICRSIIFWRRFVIACCFRVASWYKIITLLHFISPEEFGLLRTTMKTSETCSQFQWRTEGGWGFKPPPHEIPKAFQNHSKLNPIVKTVKSCWIYAAKTLRLSVKRQQNSETTAGSQLFYISIDK
jgi:hypothetical protein